MQTVCKGNFIEQLQGMWRKIKLLTEKSLFQREREERDLGSVELEELGDQQGVFRARGARNVEELAELRRRRRRSDGFEYPFGNGTIGIVRMRDFGAHASASYYSKACTHAAPHRHSHSHSHRLAHPSSFSPPTCYTNDSRPFDVCVFFFFSILFLFYFLNIKMHFLGLKVCDYF